MGSKRLKRFCVWFVASLAKMLAEKGSGRGLVSVCAAGGQGVVAILER